MQDDIARSRVPFPIVQLLYLEEDKSALPFIQLKWAGVYKDRYERLIDRIRYFNDVLIGVVDTNARVAIRESTWENNTMIITLHNKTDDLVDLTKALTHETPT